MWFRGVLASTCLALSLAVAQAQTYTNTIQADRPGAVISSNLFGIFFEEINFAGDGGLYAEMARNRSFYNSANADYWTFVTQGTASGVMSVVTNRPLNAYIPNSLKLTKQSGVGSVGAGNSGFWGMSLQSNAIAAFMRLVQMVSPGQSTSGWRAPTGARFMRRRPSAG